MAEPCVNVLYDGGPLCGSTKKTAPVHSRHHPQYHEYLDGSKPGISSIGKARERFNASERGKEYNAVTRALKSGEVACQIQSPVCTGIAQHQDEALPRGRAGGIAASLRDGPAPAPCCDRCNSYVAENAVWAHENGWARLKPPVLGEGQEAGEK